MKTKQFKWWGITLCSLVFATSCSDDNSPVQEGEDNGMKVIEDSKPEAPIEAKGFFVANEDWLGHDNGTVNYFKKNGENYDITYRAYRAANEGETFGATTQFATIWGDNAYFVSKQGNRLVVADARTLKKKAVIQELGGDGRSFLGVNARKGYVGTSQGIVTFDIPGLTIGEKIEGVSGQIGTMCYAEGKVFAVSPNNGLYVIDAQTDRLTETIAGTYNTLTGSKDGNVWIAGANKLIALNPKTLETTEFDYPEGATIGGSWGAWNAGSLCASTQHHTLYWTSGGGMFGGGKNVIRYDIENNSGRTIYSLGKSDEGEDLEFYGAGLRVDPLTDELILTVKHSGWGESGAFNWIYKLDNQGEEITHLKLRGDNGTGASWAEDAENWDGKYFWFPAMPFFEDANKPQILTNQIILKPGETKEINLEEKIVDYDNTFASMLKTAAMPENDLIEECNVTDNILTVTAGENTGETSCTLTVVSNGVSVEKNIQIVVSLEKTPL